MKIFRLLCMIGILYLAAHQTSYSQEKGFGLGIIVGEPTGLSGKYWLDSVNAVDFAIGYSLVKDQRGFSLHADYLYNLGEIIPNFEKFPLYYGFGVRLRTKEHSEGSFGARGVLGILWFNEKNRFDIFFEIAPVFNLLPSTSLSLDAGIGARYYFK